MITTNFCLNLKANLMLKRKMKDGNIEISLARICLPPN